MSFRKSAAQGSGRDADDDEITRLRKAAAWVWHTRAVGDSLVVPTKRVTPAAYSSNHSNIKTAASSRFRAEAQTSAGIHDVTSHVHDHHPSLDLGDTRLYDEFELAGLKSYMAEFVQRLQRQERAASNDDDRLNQPRTNEEIKPLKRSGSLSSVMSSRRPFSSIHKLFRKISAAVKSSKSPPMRADNQGPGQRNDRYPFNHYIQHHHHHYHYDWRPKEGFDNILRSRSHSSESYQSQQHTSSSGEEGSADDNEPRKAFSGDIFTIKVGRKHAEVPDLQLEKQTDDFPRHRRRHSEYY